MYKASCAPYAHAPEHARSCAHLPCVPPHAADTTSGRRGGRCRAYVSAQFWAYTDGPECAHSRGYRAPAVRCHGWEGEGTTWFPVFTGDGNDATSLRISVYVLGGHAYVPRHGSHCSGGVQPVLWHDSRAGSGGQQPRVRARHPL